MDLLAVAAVEDLRLGDAPITLLARQRRWRIERVSDVLAIWVAGAAVLLLIALAAGVFLRFTRVGRELDLTLGELVRVLALCVALSCALYTVIALVV